MQQARLSTEMDYQFAECPQEAIQEHTPTEGFLLEEVILILLRAGTQQEQRVVVRALSL